jgi:hypothetical protein
MLEQTLELASFNDPYHFDSMVKKTWEYQLNQNKTLGAFVQNLAQNSDIHFLPISYFKSQNIQSGVFEPEIIFSSSGTAGLQTSKHLVKHLSLYEQSFIRGFAHFYGDAKDYCFLCLLPSYLEREGSSLVYMAEYFIKNSQYKQSGFFLDDLDLLKKVILDNEAQKIPTVLLGVTFALLDFANYTKLALKHTIVMETGGMKGKRKEMVREEVHEILSNAFGVSHIHSEYGMTELLSQAYSKGNGRFYCPPWMQIKIRDVNDPFHYLGYGKTGGINVIDLANQDSCAFIETQDLGRLYEDGSFEVLGRFDNSDIRGCNLMVNF